MRDAAAGFPGRDGDLGYDAARRAAQLALSRPARLGAARLIAVDGPSGSGKSTFAPVLADALADAMGGRTIRPGRAAGAVPCSVGGRGTGRPIVTVVSTDLLATWERPLDWWPILDEQLLASIAAGRVARMPVVEWVSGNPRPGGEIVVPPVDVLVVEGVSSGRRAVTNRLSVLVWVEVTGRAARLERAVARDGEAMRPFLARWQHREAEHFAADDTRARADVTVMSGSCV